MKQGLSQLAENVWLWPHDPRPHLVQSSVGIISDSSETILIDAGNSPLLASQIKMELGRLGFPPVSYIIYTHHHWDHIYGACVFQVPIVAHTTCKAILTEESKKPWSSDFIFKEIQANPLLSNSYNARNLAISDWNQFSLRLPGIVFEKTLSLKLSNFTLELEHIGGIHAEDSILVKIPHARTMFLGDCYYPPPFHLRSPESTASLSMLAMLENKEYDLYVEGHDYPLTRIDLLQRISPASFE